MTIQKPDFNQIFASQAPDADKPPVFNNYNGGWGDESRPNNGKPTIKGFNYLQQLTDTKLLWLKQNAILPYDSDTDYPIGTVTLKDGKFQKWDGSSWIDFIKLDDSQITTWSGRTQEEKNKEFISPVDTGAVGNGVASDLVALKDASDQQGYANLSNNKIYYFGAGTTAASDPDFNVKGSGSLKWGSTVLGGYDLKLKPLYESMYLTPDSWHRATRQGLSISPEYPPYAPPNRGSDLTNIYNTVISWRSNLDDNSRAVKQVTAYGANIGVDPDDWLLTDCYGQDSAMFAKLSERNTFLGSETAVWAGAPNRQYLIDTNQDWYRNTPPNEWTVANNQMEQYNPGIGMEIYNYSNYPTDKSQVIYNTFVGRDAGCHFMRGSGNTITGYQSGMSLFEGSQNSIYGTIAAHNLTFGSNNVVSGYGAMRYSAKYSQCTVIGSLAAQSYTTGNNATIIGYSAARNTTIANNSIVIGAYAGSDVNDLSNSLFIGTSSQASVPLVGGDLTNKRVGINVPAKAERADLHVRGGAYGTTSGTNTINGIMVEGTGTQNVAIDVPDNGFAQFLAYHNGVLKAGMIYGVASNSLQLHCGDIHWRLLPSGEFRPNTTNSKDIGSGSYVVRNMHIQNAPIVSSDERLKQQFRSLDEREKVAALEIKNSICMFKFNDAVDLKGDGARWHCGVKAQQVVSILESHGLNWQEYAFVCLDEWDEQEEITDEEGSITQDHREAGSRYAIRYDELSMFILSSI